MRLAVECGQRWWRPRCWRRPRFRTLRGGYGWAFGPLMLTRRPKLRRYPGEFNVGPMTPVSFEVGVAEVRSYCDACPYPIEVGDGWRRERVGHSVPHVHRLVHHPSCPSTDPT